MTFYPEVWILSRGARVEPIKSSMASVIEKMSQTVPDKIIKATEGKNDPNKKKG